MSDEIVQQNDGIELLPRQVAALQTLHDMGAAPREEGQKYSPDRRVRMQQLIYEGRVGGPRANTGRRKARAGAEVADYVSQYLTDSIKKTLKKGLKDEEIGVRLKTVDLALKIEREESSLQLREEQTDLDNIDKEQLIAFIIGLADPESDSGAALEGAVIELPESAVTEVINGNGGTAPIPDEVGADTGTNGGNGHPSAEGYGARNSNPFVTAARRGSAK